MKPYKPLIAILTLVIVSIACKKESQSTDTTTKTSTSTTGAAATGGTVGTSVPAVYKKVYGASEIYIEGDFVVIKTNGFPDHKSPYYSGTTWSATRYEAYNGTNPLWGQNPNKIAEPMLLLKFR
jgi:hypothetical protein